MNLGRQGVATARHSESHSNAGLFQAQQVRVAKMLHDLLAFMEHHNMMKPSISLPGSPFNELALCKQDWTIKSGKIFAGNDNVVFDGKGLVDAERSNESWRLAVLEEIDRRLDICFTAMKFKRAAKAIVTTLRPRGH